MATDRSHRITIKDDQNVIQVLASAMEAGLVEALEEWTAEPVFASCRRVAKTSLQAVFGNSGTPLNVFEIVYRTGLSGGALMLIATPDLISVATLATGEDVRSETSLSQEVVEACREIISRVLESSNEQFRREHHLSIDAESPRLLNPDGGTESLQALMESCQGVAEMTFQLCSGSQLDCQIYILVTKALQESLESILPGEMADERALPPNAGEDSRSSHQVQPSPESGPFLSGMNMSQNWNIDLLLDVELPIVVSFGEAEMPLKDVLKLGVGSVIELDKAVNDPVTVLVNRKPVARGEVVMVDGNYGVRILEVESTADRIKSLG